MNPVTAGVFFWSYTVLLCFGALVRAATRRGPGEDPWTQLSLKAGYLCAGFTACLSLAHAFNGAFWAAAVYAVFVANILHFNQVILKIYWALKHQEELEEKARSSQIGRP